MDREKKIIRTAAQTAVLMAILTLGSKLLGFVREMVMAGFFGTSDITDAYVMALAIPGMIFMGFFGAIDTAYMPLFSKIYENEGQKAGNDFTSEVINIGLFIAFISFILGVFFSDEVVRIFASGFTGEKVKLTSIFLKITFSYAIFTSVAGVLEAHLRYKKVFLVPILVGYLQNVIIIGIIIISAFLNYYILVWGWLFAYLIRVLITWHLCKNERFQYSFTFNISDTAKKIMRLSLPVFVGSYINQINVFVDKTLASGLQVGSVSALNYGNLLIGIIIGLTVSIIMTIIYPKMTRAYSLNDYDSFNEMVSTGFSLILVLSIPCSLGALLYSDQIVQLVYERGAFDSASTFLTSTAFFYYSLGILFISLNNLYIQIFYSIHDMKTPMLYGAIGIIANIVLSLILVRFMAHGGLAFATSLAAAFNSILLHRALNRKYPHIKLVRSKSKILKICLSSVGAVFLSRLVYVCLMETIWFSKSIVLCLAVLAAMVFYVIFLKIFKLEELRLVKLIFIKNN